jgi:hypothetical protein
LALLWILLGVGAVGLFLCAFAVTGGAVYFVLLNDPPRAEKPKGFVVKQGPDDAPLDKQPVEKPKDFAAQEEPDPPRDTPFDVDPVLQKAEGKVFLSDLQEFAWRPGPGGWEFGKNGRLGSIWAANGRVIINGAPAEKGLSMHPPVQGYTRICYMLGRKAKSFRGAAAISEDEPGSRPPPTRFLILGDGKVLWRSGAIREWKVKEEFDVDVRNVDILELRTFVEHNHFGAHAAWVDPYVLK